jgi:hypothetical protein
MKKLITNILLFIVFVVHCTSASFAQLLECCPDCDTSVLVPPAKVVEKKPCPDPEACLEIPMPCSMAPTSPSPNPNPNPNPNLPPPLFPYYGTNMVVLGTTSNEYIRGPQLMPVPQYPVQAFGILSGSAAIDNTYYASGPKNHVEIQLTGICKHGKYVKKNAFLPILNVPGNVKPGGSYIAIYPPVYTIQLGKTQADKSAGNLEMKLPQTPDPSIYLPDSMNLHMPSIEDMVEKSDGTKQLLFNEGYAEISQIGNNTQGYEVRIYSLNNVNIFPMAIMSQPGRRSLNTATKIRIPPALLAIV